MSRNTFIVDLVSNASMVGVYTNNKIASFTTQLPGNGLQLPLQVDDDDDTSGVNAKGFWEVGLLEISYPSSFKNIVVGAYSITSKRLNGVQLHNNITPGVYRSVSEILNEIHKQISGLYFTKFGEDVASFTFFSYKYDPITYRVEIKIKENGGHLVLSTPDLRDILGYDYETATKGLVNNNIVSSDDDDDNDEGWVRASFPPDIQRLHKMLVYTDIIEHQIIGDTLGQLLRSIPMASKMKNGELSGMDYSQITKSFHEPIQFKKIQVNSFHSIHIDLYAENGERIPFIDVGHASLTLMFRFNTHHNLRL